MLIFVYGTLRSGFKNTFRQLMESQSTLVNHGKIYGRLYDLGNYPGLILSEDPTEVVHGEVYQLHNPALIKELDLYENYRANDPNSLYVRMIKPATMEDGRSVDAIVYVYNKNTDKAIRVEDGDYLRYLGQ